MLFQKFIERIRRIFGGLASYEKKQQELCNKIGIPFLYTDCPENFTYSPRPSYTSYDSEKQ